MEVLFFPVLPISGRTLPACPYERSLEDTSVEHWWNDIDGEEAKYSARNLSHCHFVRQKSYTDRPAFDDGPVELKCR
jgi:hypothetical protein